MNNTLKENDNVLKLNINSNAFEGMKEDFNKLLGKSLATMLQKNSLESTLTLKLGISLLEDEVPDFESTEPTAMRKIFKPVFVHKISTVTQIKDEEGGSLKGEYELVWDEDEQDFVMKPIDNGQCTFDDSNVTDCYEENNDNQIKQLTESTEIENDEIFENVPEELIKCDTDDDAELEAKCEEPSEDIEEAEDFEFPEYEEEE